MVSYRYEDSSSPRAKAAAATFVCYSRQDSSIALQLYRKLTARNVAVWIDRVDIEPGADWQHAIQNAVERCSHMLVFDFQAFNTI